MRNLGTNIYLSISLLSLAFLLMVFSCKKEKENLPFKPGIRELVEMISTDKSRYSPGDEVIISIKLKQQFNGQLVVRYKHLTSNVKEEIINVDDRNIELKWTPPNIDYKGYMVELVFINQEQIICYASTAVDVSSDWTKFPRYGFLSHFSSGISQAEIENNLDFLKQYHINGLQFYDWHNKHHKPLKMLGNIPASSWMDIAKRVNSFSVVESYIQSAKKLNMASMSYNLLYGAWDDFASDGVSETWMSFNDKNHISVNKHELDDNWAMSDILVLNPANTDWQDYIFNNNNEIYQHLDFDGWHIDQLGDRGILYDYNGNTIVMKNTYSSFLEHLRSNTPNRKMVLNAVNQYGQLEILKSEVDFAYTEVWSPNNSYNNLAQIIMTNNSLSNLKLNTVLAAYINYDLADNTLEFNEAAVLMADAVIMAFGGNHLELGEHMLGKEYFPNNNLSMSENLKSKLIEYYDFMVGYENLLRGGEPIIQQTDITSQEVSIKDWGAQIGSIACIKKEIDNLEVYHMLNFIGLNSLEWRDNNGILTTPTYHNNFTIEIPIIAGQQIIYSSPDWIDGVQQKLDYVMENGKAVVVIPHITYWGMIIVE